MRKTHPGTRRRLLAVALLSCFATGVSALPTDPTVVGGTASFDQAGNVLTVTNSNGAIINWQTFNIGVGETTHFIQASSSSAVLNQVLSNNPSAIYGTLSSNGQVWLVNQAGIVVGPGALIDTAGFVASTLAVRAEDFLAGTLDFQTTPGAGDVVNRGEIRTPSGGFAYLIGSNVSNEGIIHTPNGETILAAGATVSLIDTGTPGVRVEITGAEGDATNLGQIVAEAGRIGIAGSLVRNSGTLDASSVVSEGGRIFLKASQDTYVDSHGRIVATGTTGGQVEVLGNRVAVMDEAEIDVSGTHGGGTILVGGDYLGGNPEVQNAWITYFGPNASLKANATDQGNGGKVIVWADDTTRAYGSIEAKGGPNGGDGGFVETSGKRYLDVNGIKVNTQGGTWLLDPEHITIEAGYGGNIDGGGSWSQVADPYTTDIFQTGGANAILYWDNIIYNGNDVRLHASGDIVFGAGSFTYASPWWLSLWAGGDIVVGGSVDLAQGGFEMAAMGNITVNAGIDANEIEAFAGGNFTLNSGDSLIASEIYIFAANNINISGGSTVTASGAEGTVSMVANQINLGNTIDSTTGKVSAAGGIYLTFPALASGGVSIDGVQTLTSPGSLGSGFFRNSDYATPATLGNGLYTYYLGGSSAVTAAVVNELNTATQPPPTSTSPMPPAPDGSDLAGDPDQSAGGESGTFGSSDEEGEGEDQSDQGAQDADDDDAANRKKVAQCR